MIGQILDQLQVAREPRPPRLEGQITGTDDSSPQARNSVAGKAVGRDNQSAAGLEIASQHIADARGIIEPVIGVNQERAVWLQFANARNAPAFGDIE